MKDFKDYVNEMLINEANGELLVFYDWENPDNLYIVCGATKSQIRYIDGNNWISESVPYKEGNLYTIIHNDETLDIIDTGCKSSAQLKAAVMKSIKNSLKDAEPDYVEVDFGPLGISNEFEETGEGLMTEAKPEQFYKWVVELFNNSYVDGDSASARSVFDSKSKSFVMGPSEHCVFDTQSFDDWISEQND